MKLPRYLTPWVTAVVVALLALVWWRSDDAAPTELPSLPPTPVTPVHAADPAAAPAAAVQPGVALQPPAAASAFATPASLQPLDTSLMQREIQMAISTDQRGLARTAARHIQLCLAVELRDQWVREGIAAQKLSLDEARLREIRAGDERVRASCQAVDAASRAQLVPLLRRSLAEGDTRAAASLVTALGEGFKISNEPAILAGLRRDAWNCDRSSLGLLGGFAERQSQLLTPNEVGALREMRRGFAGVNAETGGDPKRKEAMERRLAFFRPPPGADAAEVARMAADIRSRCKVER